MLVVSFAWIAFVELTPASKRPYVGSSTNNTELGLTFEYNGFGRVEGQIGGPNSTSVRPGAYVPAARQRAVDATARAHPAPAEAPTTPVHLTPAAVPGPAIKVTGREKDPIPFGEAPEPLRLFGKGLGDQAGWLLPFALFGLLALLALVALAFLDRRRDQRTPTPLLGASLALSRRDPRACGRARARRLVRRRGGRAQPLQGHRPPLLRLRARARNRRDGRRRRRPRSSSSRAGATACGASRSPPARSPRPCSWRSC